MLTTALLLAAPEGGGGGLTDINLGLTIWTVVVFLLFATVLAKFAWRPLLDLIELRERTVREQVQSAEKAHHEAETLLTEQKEMLREAGWEGGGEAQGGPEGTGDLQAQRHDTRTARG